MSARRFLTFAFAFAFALAFAYNDASAQAVDEVTVIHNAEVKEQTGDFAGAAQLLESVLNQNPLSLSALIGLERVLRIENKLPELVTYVQLHLKADNTSAIGHQMLVRTYSALDQVSDIERAGAAWIDATPKVETPYREIARVWQQRGDYQKALQVLEQGRSKVHEEDALALELGDVYATLERYPDAVREWSRAIGPTGHGLLLIQRRLSAMKDGGARLLPSLVDALVKSPTTMARRRAAAQLAIDAGLSDRAERIVSGIASELKAAEKQNFLVEIARHADAANLTRVAYYAYTQLVPAGMNTTQMLALRARIAELALAVGDTTKAAADYQALEQSLAAGSPERRQAVGLRIQLAAKEGKLSEAEQQLAAFRTEFPGAPELDAVAATIASGYLDKDDPVAAERSVAGVVGPRSSIARGRIALRRGDVATAKNELLTAAPSLQGAEATETIRLVTLLGRVSREGGELLGQSIARAGAGAPKDAITLLEKGTATLPEQERPSVLDFAAALADRSDLHLDAERMRRRIVLEYPKSIEAPSALLGLARSLTERGEAVEEAKEYLEKLILEYPRSALVPQARQELDRLQGRIPRS